MEKNVGSVDRDIIFLFVVRGSRWLQRAFSLPRVSDSNKNEGEQLNDTSIWNERERKRKSGV